MVWGCLYAAVSPSLRVPWGQAQSAAAPKGPLHGFLAELESLGEGMSGGGALGPSLGHAEASLGDMAELGRGVPRAGPSKQK